MKTNRLSWITAAGATLLLVLGGGCTTSREVSVDAQAQPTFTGENQKKPQSYVIRVKPHPNQPGSELRDQEAIQHVKTALSAQGLWEAPNSETADLVVEVDYGIDPARVRFDVLQIPLYGRPRPNVQVKQRQVAAAPDVEGGGWGIGTGRLDEFEEVTVAVMIREKHLTISGRENKPVAEGRMPAEVFRVSASIEDESPNLRDSLPVLASAVIGQIGQTTEGAEVSKIKENSAEVVFIKRGMESRFDL
jgi:hypothetical protein